MVEFAYKAYRRTFAKEYQTASHELSQRPGILLRLRDGDGRVGFGEIAPIESFETESLLAALSRCEELQGKFEYEESRDSLNSFPCLQFATESAYEMLGVGSVSQSVDAPWPVCGLVADATDRSRIEGLLEQGYRTIKFKIGKSEFAEERRNIDAFVEGSDGKIGIRLDANGSLDRAKTIQWLEYASDVPVEYLEQPMAKGSEREMSIIARDFPARLALDESVCFVDDLKRWNDFHWEGVYVVKPSIAGGRRALLDELLRIPDERVVFSSSLETLVGASTAIGLAIESTKRSRALAFGVEDLFQNDGASLQLGPFLQSDSLGSIEDFEELWKTV